MDDKRNLNARVTRQMAARAEAVFNAWVDPEQVRKWFAPGMGEMVRVEAEPKVGGQFSFVQRRGSDDVDHTGEYLVFEQPNHLAFTWGVPKYSPDISRVDVVIEPREGGCEVRLTHEVHPNWADYIQRTEQAWGKMLEAMAEALAEPA
jgi:uncharacterized protein YndB with AHSA1/START domain